MNLVDQLLGPRIEREFEDEGRTWTMSMRPRRTGPPVTRTTMISFRRSDSRSGFGVQMWALRLVARSKMAADPIAESSIQVTRAMAQKALDWADGLEEK